MINIEIIGFIAGTIAVGAFLPQAIKTFKTRQTGDLSTVMLIMQMACVGLWMIYGILKQSPSLIICNFFTLAVVASVFIMKLSFESRSKSPNSKNGNPTLPTS